MDHAHFMVPGLDFTLMFFWIEESIQNDLESNSLEDSRWAEYLLFDNE